MRFRYFKENIHSLAKNEIFVFGSNYKGVHGSGAARLAKDKFNAVWGVSEGFTGYCYAIPTKDLDIKTLPLETIAKHVDRFIDATYIKDHLTFIVTAVGTGLAKYDSSDIAPMFRLANHNCVFDQEWEPFLETGEIILRKG